jgi:AcrR family transcriptional regulator
MRARAEQVDETRQRIVAATVELHGTVGPAATTISAIADLANVTRLTVYRHFPDETSLFNACGARWMSQQRLPDPAAWEQISHPAERLRAGLADLYRFFHAGAGMLANIYRDFAALPQEHQQLLLDQDQRHREILLAPFPRASSRSRRLRAVIGHASSFWTWHSLCIEQGLSDQEAVEIMAGMVAAVLPDGREMMGPDASVSSR